ncbi:MAG: DUF4114 domain-containing protein [Deltaproteobacteria bacterium]|nr:DUF4114 domain-containing protein [Deltaproteobacteria bacterium]
MSGTTVNVVNTLQVFAGGDNVGSDGSDTSLEFDLLAGTVKNSITGVTASIGKNFGFYLTTQEGYTFYTHTSLNADNKDHFRVYDTSAHTGTGFSQSDVVLGIEDLYNLGDHDYDDMVVGVTDVSPVPEPGTMLLFGIGMLGLAVYGKRRMNKEA